MNQLQLFVATTEWLRADLLRCLRKLKPLDRRVQEHMAVMRSVIKDLVEVSAKTLSTPAVRAKTGRPRKREREEGNSSSSNTPLAQERDRLARLYVANKQRVDH